MGHPVHKDVSKVCCTYQTDIRHTECTDTYRRIYMLRMFCIASRLQPYASRILCNIPHHAVCAGRFHSSILFKLLFEFRRVRRETRIVKWVIDLSVLTSLLPWLYPHPAHPWLPWLEQILYSNIYLYTVLGVYAGIEISLWITKCMNRRTNPALLLSGSFIIFIIIGTGLLMLPDAPIRPYHLSTRCLSPPAPCASPA